MKKILFFLCVVILIVIVFVLCSLPREASEEQSELFQEITGFALVGWLIGGDGVDMITTDEGFRVIYNDYPIDEEGKSLLSGIVVYEEVDEGDYYEVDLDASVSGDGHSIESSFIDGSERVDFTMDGKKLYVLQ